MVWALHLHSLCPHAHHDFHTHQTSTVPFVRFCKWRSPSLSVSQPWSFQRGFGTYICCWDFFSAVSHLHANGKMYGKYHPQWNSEKENPIMKACVWHFNSLILRKRHIQEWLSLEHWKTSRAPLCLCLTWWLVKYFIPLDDFPIWWTIGWSPVLGHSKYSETTFPMQHQFMVAAAVSPP